MVVLAWRARFNIIVESKVPFDSEQVRTKFSSRRGRRAMQRAHA
jgi:hypothetical protein